MILFMSYILFASINAYYTNDKLVTIQMILLIMQRIIKLQIIPYCIIIISIIQLQQVKNKMGQDYCKEVLRHNKLK